MLIVYISNRRDIARETLVHVENLMPFITEAVFVCPGSQVRDFHFRSVLGKDFRRFQAAGDHQFKNCLLRFSWRNTAETTFRAFEQTFREREVT